jgi:Ion transport protein
MSTKAASRRMVWSDGDTTPTPFDLFILALAILSLVNFVLILLPISDTSKAVIIAVDAVVSIFLLIDFGMRLGRARSRRQYFFRNFGWLDLLGSLPFPLLRIFRLWRVIRQVHIVRMEEPDRVWRDFIRSRAQSTLLFVVLLVLITVEAGSIAVLWADRNADDANIKTASDALWWCMATITTIGYGDRFPVTNSGRLVGVWLMIVGVGLFGTFTAFVANAFVAPHAARAAAPDHELRAMVGEQQQMLRDLAAQVAAATTPSDAGSEVVVAGEPPESHVAPGGRDVEGDEAMRQGRRHRRL